MSSSVRVRPGEYLIEVRRDESVMDAARRQGLAWPNLCGGNAECSVCHFEVLEGAEYLLPSSAEEQDRLRQAHGAKIRRGHNLRLACQARIDTGQVVVLKRGVRRLPEPALE